MKMSNPYKTGDAAEGLVTDESSLLILLLTVLSTLLMITEALVKQQKISSLPLLIIPIFNLKKRKKEKITTEDGLYFIGQPRELVCSCQYMHFQRGYAEAKRLLKHHFGDEYRIAALTKLSTGHLLNLKTLKL